MTPPDWPRLMSRELAASYCGVSAPTFDKVCPVTPRTLLPARRIAWDRYELDKWITTLPHRGGEEIPERSQFDPSLWAK